MVASQLDARSETGDAAAGATDPHESARGSNRHDVTEVSFFMTLVYPVTPWCMRLQEPFGTFGPPVLLCPRLEPASGNRIDRQFHGSAACAHLTHEHVTTTFAGIATDCGVQFLPPTLPRHRGFLRALNPRPADHAAVFVGIGSGEHRASPLCIARDGAWVAADDLNVAAEEVENLPVAIDDAHYSIDCQFAAAFDHPLSPVSDSAAGPYDHDRGLRPSMLTINEPAFATLDVVGVPMRTQLSTTFVHLFGKGGHSSHYRADDEEFLERPRLDDGLNRVHAGVSR